MSAVRTSAMMAMLLAVAHVCTNPLKNMSAAYAYAWRSSEPGTPAAWLDDAGMAAVYMTTDSCDARDPLRPPTS